MIEEFSKVNYITTHVKEEISNVEHCDLMRNMNIEKESIEIEEKKRLVERLCVFDSMSTLFEKCEQDECEKEKEIDVEKSERVKESECFISKQESKEEEQKRKRSSCTEKSEVVSIFANQTNSFFETKLYSFAIIFYRISLKHPCTLTLMLGRNHTMDHENSSMSPFLNPSLLSHEKLELLPNFMFLILNDLPNLCFQFRQPFKDIVENVVIRCHLQDFYTFTYAFLGRSLVNFECFLYSPSLSHLVLNFFAHTTFAYHRPFKEVIDILLSFV
ncbi:hypothetical protein M9H77_31374 [Catharanthus roseus]|uniref:Uncharacterized protein n=1 Tax=Catharanthus roseus TaxID=4058 RepID=A0ACC0A165_CATRO|nr:hypothetical protein M9H77_31374 [Catharanthus roseus]